MAYSSPNLRLFRSRRTHGRGLYERGVEHLATHAKLWLFALRRARLVVLDADMVVLGPLDWLTHWRLPAGNIAAIGFGHGGPRGASARFFNSGLMVMQPASSDLHNLTRLALLARSGPVPVPGGSDRSRAAGAGDNETVMIRAGERHFGDQSLLNWNFRYRWRALPAGVMAVAPAKVGVDGSRILAADPAVVHWLSEPKPWSMLGQHQNDRPAKPTRPSGGMTAQAQLWWRL